MAPAKHSFVLLESLSLPTAAVKASDMVLEVLTARGTPTLTSTPTGAGVSQVVLEVLSLPDNKVEFAEIVVEVVSMPPDGDPAAIGYPISI